MSFYDYLYEEHRSNPQRIKEHKKLMNEMDKILLPLLYHIECDKEFKKPTCPICLQNIPIFSMEETRCNHKFHSKCITRWKRSGKNSCPICRSPLSDLPSPQVPEFFNQGLNFMTHTFNSSPPQVHFQSSSTPRNDELLRSAISAMFGGSS